MAFEQQFFRGEHSADVKRERADGCVFCGFIFGEHLAKPFDCGAGFSLEAGFDDLEGVKFAIPADK